MKRTNKKKKSLSVDAILTADWHLRESTPTCRTDDFEEAQWNSVKQVSSLQEKYDCPVLHAGDLFDHWKPSPRLLTLATRYLPHNFHTVYGQHDLPQHNLDLAEKSGINNLLENERIHKLSGAHWGIDPEEVSPILIEDREVLVWHHLTYQTKPFPGAKEGMAAGLLRKYDQFDLIVTGDNHQAFTEKYKGRLLVNPGNLTRQVADQADFRPRVYLWNARKNKVKPVFLNIEKDVVSREHIEQKEERDERISAFVQRLGTEWEADLDFETNLERFIRENDISEETEEICFKALEGE